MSRYVSINKMKKSKSRATVLSALASAKSKADYIEMSCHDSNANQAVCKQLLVQRILVQDSRNV
jgi:hypothetical protein